MAYSQRLGYLLGLTDFKKKSDMLADWIAKANPRFAKLHPSLPMKGYKKNEKWNIWINAEIEGDLS